MSEQMLFCFKSTVDLRANLLVWNVLTAQRDATRGQRKQTSHIWRIETRSTGIVYGLLCDRDGRPIAIEVFEGDTGDPSTLTAQVDKLKRRFGLRHVVLVGDRGMITAARIREDLRPAGLDWITSLRAPQIQDLAETGPLQLSLFDERDLAEITAPDYPGERLIVCRNPDLARERARGFAGCHRA
jgi:hypothetical protein